MASTVKTYRFKFTPEFLDVLTRFSITHQYDTPKDFKEAFGSFKDEFKNEIEREINVLNENGYKGDAIDKMYKSARYYFKNKDYSQKNKTEKKRRKYITQDKEFISSVDEHIETIIENMKPSDGFEQFKEKFTEEYNNEQERLSEYLVDKLDIEQKIKKTYKNRYFINQKYNKTI